jgi:hypothetical protein
MGHIGQGVPVKGIPNSPDSKHNPRMLRPARSSRAFAALIEVPDGARAVFMRTPRQQRLFPASYVGSAVDADPARIQHGHCDRVAPRVFLRLVVFPEFEAGQLQRGDVVLGRVTVDAAMVFILVVQRSGLAVLRIPQIDPGLRIRAVAIAAFLPVPGPLALPLLGGDGREL